MNKPFLTALAILLAGVQLTSACSIAYPEFYHIDNIELTEDSNRLMVTLKNDWDSPEVTKVFIVNEEVFIDPQGGDVIVEELLEETTNDLTSEVIESEDEIIILLKGSNEQTVFNSSLHLNFTDMSEFASNHLIVTSERLDLVFFLTNSHTNLNTNKEFDSAIYVFKISTGELLETQLIDIQYYFWATDLGYQQYDEVSLIRFQGHGADCVTAGWFRYHESGFQDLEKQHIYEDTEFDPRINSRITLNWDFDGIGDGSSKITVTNYLLGNSTSFTFTHEEISELIGGEEKLISALPITLASIALGFMAITVISSLNRRMNKNTV